MKKKILRNNQHLFPFIFKSISLLYSLRNFGYKQEKNVVCPRGFSCSSFKSCKLNVSNSTMYCLFWDRLKLTDKPKINILMELNHFMNLVGKKPLYFWTISYKIGHCEKKDMCVLSLYTFFSGKKWKSESGNCRMSSRNVANYNDLSWASDFNL